ncbi:hypothetical protein VCHC57A1_1583, partial [Vibrio cholerae HC-57A1]
MRARFSTA